MANGFNKISQHFTCDICQDRYKQPKILDCVHSFCQACLEEYYTGRYKDAPKIPCPVCQHETILPDTRIQGLKTNFHLMGIIEEVSKEETVAHSGDESKCHKHKGEEKWFYCETCQELICRACTVLDHCKPNHQYIDRGKASLKYKQSLKDVFLDFNTDIKGLEQSLAASSEAQQKFTKKVNKTIKTVQERAAKLRAEITTQEKTLLDKIDQIQQDGNRVYDEHQKSISTMLEGKQHMLEMAKDVTNTPSECDFLSLYPIITDDFKYLKSKTPPRSDIELSCPSFTPGQWTGAISLGKLEEDKWEMCCGFGKRGKGPGAFDGAWGITATQPGEIAVADFSNKRVVICSNEGQPKESIPLQSYPRDIAAIHNLDNQLVVVDDTKYVKVLDKNKLAFQFPTVPQSEVDKTEVNLWSVAVRKDGTILVGDVERMVWTEHRPTDGQLLHTVPVQTPPYFLAVDHCTERVVVCGVGKQKVDVAASDGETRSIIEPTINGKPAQCCRGVCCNGSGIYITVCNELGTGHIHHYDLDGVFLSCLAQYLRTPCGITFTSDGQLAISEPYSVKMYQRESFVIRHDTNQQCPSSSAPKSQR